MNAVPVQLICDLSGMLESGRIAAAVQQPGRLSESETNGVRLQIESVHTRAATHPTPPPSKMIRTV